MKALVTGASGLLGVHLTSQLVRRGIEVRAFHLPSDPMPADLGVDFEPWPGDVRDPDALRRATRGCSVVYHAAGRVSYWSGHRALLEAIHVDGTRHAVQAALAAGVERFVHTSSVAAIGYSTAGPASETTPYNFGAWGIGYMDTKRAAEQIVLEAVGAGLPAVIVNPTGLIGPGAPQLSTLSLMRSLLRGRVPGAPPGGVNVVPVEDAARGHIVAAERGAVGQRYILGGENLKHLALLRETAAAIGAAQPTRSFPGWLLEAAGLAGDAAAWLTGRPPGLLTRARAALSQLDLFYSSERAARQLGYASTSLSECLRRTYQWYVENGHLPERRLA